METMKSGFWEKYLTPIAVVVGALIIAAAFAFGHGGTTQQPQNGQQAAAVDIKDVKTDGEPFIGNANAPVTMAIWFDYQCPFCQQFEQQVTTKLNDEYVKSGKLRIVFKDFQFLGNDSDDAALFGRAVWDAYPDHYYEWLVAMFDAQDDEGDQGFGDMASIEALTAEKVTAIDVAKVKSLIAANTNKYQAAISADRAEGASFGINGTPSVIIGKTLLAGGQSYANVQTAVEAELKH